MLDFVTWRTVSIILCLGCSGIAAQDCGNFNEYLCGSGECIPKEYLCDGSKECIDGSDETLDLCQFRSCSQSFDYIDRGEHDIFAIPSLGTGKTFRCGYGACISNQFICDGIRHCVADSSDETEELCSKFKCTSKQFRCDYGGCVRKRNACDNRYHCFDHSDETTEACTWRKPFCNRHIKFKCANMACIQKSKKCDGKMDCLDGSDESVSTCGPGAAPVTKPTMTRNRPTIPPPTLPPLPEHPIGHPIPVITPQPTTHITPGSNQPPSVPVGEGKGCRQADDTTTSLEIIACGDDSSCTGQTLPAGTVMLIYCGDQPTPLQCDQDDLWHFIRDPNKAPRKKPCEDAGPSTRLISTPSTSRIYTEVPTDCGTLSPFTPIPWLVGLFRNGNFSCTGTVIGPALILSAAHCIVSNQATNTRLIDRGAVKVQFNSDNPNDPREFISVTAMELHPHYIGGDTLRADIALIFLAKNLAESNGLSSACLDDKENLLSKPAWTFNRTIGQTAYRWTNFRQNFDRSCVNKAAICTRHLSIGDNQFCAINEQEPKFLHQGASGGPYFIQNTENGRDRWAVAGVVSSSIQTTECGTRTVFTYVNRFRNWIINCGFKGNCKV